MVDLGVPGSNEQKIIHFLWYRGSDYSGDLPDPHLTAASSFIHSPPLLA